MNLNKAHIPNCRARALSFGMSGVYWHVQQGGVCTLCTEMSMQLERPCMYHLKSEGALCHHTSPTSRKFSSLSQGAWFQWSLIFKKTLPCYSLACMLCVNFTSTDPILATKPMLHTFTTGANSQHSAIIPGTRETGIPTVRRKA